MGGRGAGGRGGEGFLLAVEWGWQGERNTKQVRSVPADYYKEVLSSSIYPASWYLKNLTQTSELL